MEAYKSKFFEFCDKIDSFLETYPICQTIKEKVHCRLSFIILGLVAILSISSVISLGAALLVNVIAIAYPAICSIKALESSNKDDDSKWLTYWIIFALFSLVESFGYFILKYSHFYYPIKCVFLFVCYYPQTNFAQIIYEKYVTVYLIPLIQKYEKRD
ncbi:hypothetical protein WA158_001082 [Blastocystis sp. Blastoise]